MSKINKKPTIFKNDDLKTKPALIYISDPWHTAANAKVRNLAVLSKTAPPTPKPQHEDEKQKDELNDTVQNKMEEMFRQKNMWKINSSKGYG